MAKIFDAQIDKLIAMREDFNEAISGALIMLSKIEERNNSQEWLDYAKEYNFHENDFVNVVFDRLAYAEQCYEDACAHLFLDDFVLEPLDEIV